MIRLATKLLDTNKKEKLLSLTDKSLCLFVQICLAG